jgi:SAM-dependent methyltransferase
MSQPTHFADVADRYDDLRSEEGVAPLVDVLLREGDLAGARVLEIGCGTGRVLNLVGGHAAALTGVDASPEMIEVARRKLGADVGLSIASAEDLPFEDRSFDAALMVLVVQHVDRPRAFGEARRVLASGGRVLVATPDPNAFPRSWMAPLFPSFVAVEQARFPRPEALVDELTSAGFRGSRFVRVALTREVARERALAALRGRAFSTFDLIEDAEFDAGVARAERELPARVSYSLDWAIVVGDR